MVFNKGRTAAIIAHEREALEKIFRKVKFAWENLPEWLRPAASMENKRELAFDEIGSNIYIALKIRSGTVHHLHVSEIAYIKDQEELRSGSYQAVPKTGDISNETTAQGLGDWYEHWVNCKEDPIWRNHFYPWVMHKDYQSGIPYQIDTHEEYLEGCTERQKNWWYIKFKEHKLRLNEMKREYPLTEDDSFTVAARGIFNDYIDILDELKEIKDFSPEFQSVLDNMDDKHKKNVKIYEEPIKGHTYCMGADTSGGYADGDPASFHIMNAKTRTICVEFNGTIKPDLFAYPIMEWAKVYNYAFSGIEVNNHGLTTINEIKELYSELYIRERRDKVTDTMTKEIGWLTTDKSRDELLDEVGKSFHSGDVTAVTPGMLAELKTFVLNENGKAGAMNGCHDDRVMSYGICLMMIRHNPHFEVKQKVSKYMGRVVKYKHR